MSVAHYANDSGGAIAATRAEISISNSIVVGNVSQYGANAILGSARLRSSIVGDDGRELFSHTTRIAPGIFAGDLADNGGRTQTAALLPGRDNPATDSADARLAAATDQRGVARDAHPDIGAFEAQGRDGAALIGSDRQDILWGTDRSDQIDGRGGDDVMRGLAGGDDLRGGADDDTVRGNRGNDVVDGGGGSDDFFGGRHDDSLRGTASSSSSGSAST